MIAQFLFSKIILSQHKEYKCTKFSTNTSIFSGICINSISMSSAIHGCTTGFWFQLFAISFFSLPNGLYLQRRSGYRLRLHLRHLEAGLKSSYYQTSTSSMVYYLPSTCFIYKENMLNKSTFRRTFTITLQLGSM
jgi:hypothetical protein